MAIPAIAWIAGAFLLFGGGSSTPTTPNNTGPVADPLVARIQKALLALGFSDGTLVLNGIWDLSTQAALALYFKASGGFIPLSRAELAARLEAELAGKPPPNLNYVPPPELLKRVAAALAKLGFADLGAYFDAKQEFPLDSNSAAAWNALVTRLELEAGIKRTSSTANYR